MEEIKSPQRTIRFGVFEVETGAGELRRQGVRIKLQEQPFLILMILLERPGEVVTREELQKRLWPADTFVDFERGLNRAINRLREALGDDADNPRFIETLPRRGYRFVAPVDTGGGREVETAGRSRLVLLPPGVPAENTVSTVSARQRQVLSWAVTGVLMVTAAVAYWRPWRVPQIVADRPFLQFDLDVGPDEFSQPAISPDGMRVVFVSKGALSIRRLDQAKVTRLAGTEGASLPFFSPTGQWVAFFAAGKLQKLAVDGGTPIQLCDAPEAGGGSWGYDDQIIARVNSQGISRIPALGGSPELLTDSNADPSGVLMHLWPQALPGGKGVLFAATNGSAHGSLRILTAEGRKIKTIVENSTYGRYLASGYLVYYQRGTLFAAPIDLNRLALTGPAVPFIHGVSEAGGFGRAEFDASLSGTLVYRGGTAGTGFLLSWLYPSGKTEPVLTKTGSYWTPRLSPDGKRLAISVFQEGRQNLWVYDLSRETWTKITFDAAPSFRPTWTADGEFLAFRSGNALAWRRSDGSGKVEYLTGVSPNACPGSFSADGKWLTFWPLQRDSDLWTVPVERTPGLLRLGLPQPLLQQAGSKGGAAISPDGRWLAYNSNESGRFEIYVMPFSPQRRAARNRWLVSNAGGSVPIWSQNGRELFYQSLDRRVQVAAYTVRGDSFLAEKARLWSEIRLGDTGIFPSFDVAPDGQRVMALLAAGDPRAETFIRVLLNVESNIRRSAPAYGK